MNIAKDEINYKGRVYLTKKGFAECVNTTEGRIDYLVRYGILSATKILDYKSRYLDKETETEKYKIWITKKIKKLLLKIISPLSLQMICPLKIWRQ